MSRLQAVLCDMDGTLVDTEPYWEEAKYALAAEYDVPFTQEDIAALVGRSMAITIEALQEAGVPLSHDEVLNYLVSYVVEKSRTSATPWLPGAQDFLARMKQAGIPVALVTQAWAPVAERVVAASDNAIICMVTGGDVEHPKPHPEPYLMAAEKLGIEISRCVAIEDSPSGVESAERAGCPVFVVPGIHPVPVSSRRFPVASLAEIDLDSMDRVLDSN